MGSSSEESDTSEFERIEPDMIPIMKETRNQASDDEEEENKMDVAGARPVEELVRKFTSMSSFCAVPELQNMLYHC